MPKDFHESESIGRTHEQGAPGNELKVPGNSGKAPEQNDATIVRANLSQFP